MNAHALWARRLGKELHVAAEGVRGGVDGKGEGDAQRAPLAVASPPLRVRSQAAGGAVKRSTSPRFRRNAFAQLMRAKQAPSKPTRRKRARPAELLLQSAQRHAPAPIVAVVPSPSPSASSQNGESEDVASALPHFPSQSPQPPSEPVAQGRAEVASENQKDGTLRSMACQEPPLKKLKLCNEEAESSDIGAGTCTATRSEISGGARNPNDGNSDIDSVDGNDNDNDSDNGRVDIGDGDGDEQMQTQTETETEQETPGQQVPPMLQAQMAPLQRAVVLEQVCLDVGQKNIGSRRCDVCGVLYYPGQQQDEKVHRQVHDTVVNGVSFRGWKDEDVIRRFTSKQARIIHVRHDLTGPRRETVLKVMRMLHSKLGGGERDKICEPGEHIYMYICKGRVVGCVVAQSMNEAWKMQLTPRDEEASAAIAAMTRPLDELVFDQIQTLRSKQTVPVTMAINYMWVLPKHRQQGIASRMIDAIRSTFVLGGYSVVHKARCAFTEPTAMGKLFAAKYTSGDIFGPFLVSKLPKLG